VRFISRTRCPRQRLSLSTRTTLRVIFHAREKVRSPTIYCENIVPTIVALFQTIFRVPQHYSVPGNPFFPTFTIICCYVNFISLPQSFKSGTIWKQRFYFATWSNSLPVSWQRPLSARPKATARPPAGCSPGNPLPSGLCLWVLQQIRQHQWRQCRMSGLPTRSFVNSLQSADQ
jgi:hypothetical protein